MTDAGVMPQIPLIEERIMQAGVRRTGHTRIGTELLRLEPTVGGLWRRLELVDRRHRAIRRCGELIGDGDRVLTRGQIRNGVGGRVQTRVQTWVVCRRGNGESNAETAAPLAQTLSAGIVACARSLATGWAASCDIDGIDSLTTGISAETSDGWTPSRCASAMTRSGLAAYWAAISWSRTSAMTKSNRLLPISAMVEGTRSPCYGERPVAHQHPLGGRALGDVMSLGGVTSVIPYCWAAG